MLSRRSLSIALTDWLNAGSGLKAFRQNVAFDNLSDDVLEDDTSAINVVCTNRFEPSLSGNRLDHFFPKYVILFPKLHDDKK
jgi:hypothetical protein